MTESIIILGGGIIGLASAHAAAGRGYRVTVLEAGKTGGQASGAAAGMLAPYSENTEQPDDFFRLCRESLNLYPDWLKEIEEETGDAIEWHRSGSLNIVFHEADIEPLRTRLRWQNECGARAELVEGAELRRLEPMLTGAVQAALLYPDESHVYAPALVQALERACIRRGVNIVSHTGAIANIAAEASHVIVETERKGRFIADRLVVAAGAWTGGFERWFGLQLPIHPIRGQICAYPIAVGDIRHIVVSSQAYWTAKNNGTLVCGASEDVAGFDHSVTERGIGRLTRYTSKAFPLLADVPVVHRWAGLRPATRDGLPLLGKLSGMPNIIMAAGHYRNGILLAPVTAAAVVALLDGAEEPVSLRACSPERFGYAAGAPVWGNTR